MDDHNRDEEKDGGEETLYFYEVRYVLQTWKFEIAHFSPRVGDGCKQERFSGGREEEEEAKKVNRWKEQPAADQGRVREVGMRRRSRERYDNDNSKLWGYARGTVTNNVQEMMKLIQYLVLT